MGKVGGGGVAVEEIMYMDTLFLLGKYY